MHIGVLTHNYPRFAGDFSGTFVAALCEEFVCLGERVTVWAPYDPAYDPALARAVCLEPYRYVWPDRLHRLGYMRSMQADLKLRYEAYLLSPALFAAGISYVMHRCRRTRPDVLHAHWVLPNGFIAAVVSRRLGIPLVVSAPGSDAQVSAQNPLFGAMARYVFRQSSLLTANSEALRDSVVSLGADASKFDMIVYGVDPQELIPDDRGVAELRVALRIPEQAVVVLCVGRMVPKKGFDVLLRALAEPELATRPVFAVLIGEGDKWVEWQRLGESLELGKRLRWIGNVPKDQIGVYYNLADILAMPSVSRPADGLNVCVLDAMSCGKPVVGTPAAGNRLAIDDRETGLIVDEQDASALAQVLALLADDGDLRTRMGRAGRRRIENELGWPHLARRYNGHFRRLAGM